MFKNMINIIILAAGLGKRMCSNFPKIFYTIAGKTMIQRVIDTALSLNPLNIYIIHNDNINFDILKTSLKKYSIIKWILQKQQLGTGDAVKKVIPFISKNEDILILYADYPLIRKQTLIKMMQNRKTNEIKILTAVIDNPYGYGRIIRKNGKITKIIEQKDLNKKLYKIHEINTGVLIINSSDLIRFLKKIKNNNSQKEYYITDIIKLAYQNGYQINSINPKKLSETMGINNCNQLSQLERIFQREQAEILLSKGVLISDPNRFDLRGNIKCGKNVFIDINVIIEGTVFLGNNVRIYSGCILKNCFINKNSIIYSYSLIENAKIAKNCKIGPFANIRTNTNLNNNVCIGNFVETKNASFGKNTKANHLSYLGDSKIGSNVNIGAGTITCNYNGIKKFTTIIKDNVFIGADSQLIAPITIDKGATVGAGTTLTNNINQNELVISRVKQKHFPNWKRPIKEK